jgi:hypothetical protein
MESWNPNFFCLNPSPVLNLILSPY